MKYDYLRDADVVSLWETRIKRLEMQHYEEVITERIGVEMLKELHEDDPLHSHTTEQVKDAVEARRTLALALDRAKYVLKNGGLTELTKETDDSVHESIPHVA